MQKYEDKVRKAIDRVNAGFTDGNLLALRISIDKYLWKKLNRETSLKLKELVEELPKETSVGMLKHKLEFWKLKHPGIEYDPEKLAIVKIAGGDSQ